MPIDLSNDVMEYLHCMQNTRSQYQCQLYRQGFPKAKSFVSVMYIVRSNQLLFFFCAVRETTLFLFVLNKNCFYTGFTSF